VTKTPSEFGLKKRDFIRLLSGYFARPSTMVSDIGRIARLVIGHVGKVEETYLAM
jgi:hypothetical protein